MYLLCTQHSNAFSFLFVFVVRHCPPNDPPLKNELFLRFWQELFRISERQEFKSSESRNVEKFTEAKEVQKASKSRKARRLRKFESSTVQGAKGSKSREVEKFKRSHVQEVRADTSL